MVFKIAPEFALDRLNFEEITRVSPFVFISAFWASRHQLNQQGISFCSVNVQEHKELDSSVFCGIENNIFSLSLLPQLIIILLDSPIFFILLLLSPKQPLIVFYSWLFFDNLFYLCNSPCIGLNIYKYFYTFSNSKKQNKN